MRVFIALLLVAAANAAAPIYKVGEPIPGRYIVKLKDDVDLRSLASSVRRSGGRVKRLLGIINGFSAELSSTVVDLVSKLPGVEYIEEDCVVRTDASYGSWGQDRIDQRDLPLSESYRYPGPSYYESGTPVVYIIDTGIRESHKDFGGWASQEANFADVYDYDCDGHGTHCAGTVGSITYGVRPYIHLVGVKVFPCYGSASSSDVIAGVNWVKEDVKKYSNPATASMSLGSSGYKAMDEAVEALVASGVPVAVSAGNDAFDACNKSPARAKSATTVGSTDWNDKRSSFSNYGSCVDIFAPGSSITSTSYKSDYADEVKSGTSMSCPHVAGALAAAEGKTGREREAWVLGMAAQGRLKDIKSTSPNKLLYIG